MDKAGLRHTKTRVKGHQNCGICHPTLKNVKKRGRRERKMLVKKGDE